MNIRNLSAVSVATLLLLLVAVAFWYLAPELVDIGSVDDSHLNVSLRHIEKEDNGYWKFEHLVKQINCSKQEEDAIESVTKDRKNLTAENQILIDQFRKKNQHIINGFYNLNKFPVFVSPNRIVEIMSEKNVKLTYLSTLLRSERIGLKDKFKSKLDRLKKQLKFLSLIEANEHNLVLAAISLHFKAVIFEDILKEKPSFSRKDKRTIAKLLWVKPESYNKIFKSEYQLFLVFGGSRANTFLKDQWLFSGIWPFNNNGLIFLLKNYLYQPNRTKAIVVENHNKLIKALKNPPSSCTNEIKGFNGLDIVFPNFIGKGTSMYFYPIGCKMIKQIHEHNQRVTDWSQ